MGKYICQICGYVYDEAKEAVRFDSLPDSWTCPLCGAPKNQFKKADEAPVKAAPEAETVKAAAPHSDELRPMTDGELAALCSNLARGCEKQYKAEEAALYSTLAAYFTGRAAAPANADFDALAKKINANLDSEFAAAFSAADSAADRGAKRALTWSEKVTRMSATILARYKKEGNAMLENTKIWVCDICGFIFIGDEPPAVCPICKVPSFKIQEVARG